MKSAAVLLVTILVCLASLLVRQIGARPYDNQLTDKERQVALEYAVQIVRNALAMRNGDTMYAGTDSKRNSGMMDAVLQLPDLMAVGRK